MNFGLTLLPNAVLQRNANDVSAHPFAGSAKYNGNIVLTVRGLPGFEARRVGTAARGKCSGVIDNLPVGGPYTLDFAVVDDAGKAREKLSIRNVLVGDLWLLAGQSNMQGYGYMPALTPTQPLIHNFYMDNRWDIAEEPLHNLLQAAAPVHGGNPAYPEPRITLRGVGPGLAFAAAMLEATGVPQGTIACAHGGTSMDQWSPQLKKMGGNSLYGALCERLKQLGGRVAGVLWYQGCNDAGKETDVQSYEAKTRRLFAAFRRDARDPELPIVFAQLASLVQKESNGGFWNRVRNAQYRIGCSMKRVVCVPTIDLELDDTIHLSARSQQILGRRMADAMRYISGDSKCPAPIEAGRITVRQDAASGNANITVEFKNVVGKLVAAGLPNGFAPVAMNGDAMADCFKVELDGSKAIVHTTVPTALARHCGIAYGAGLRPYANITDEAGRSLPCFMKQVSLRRGCFTSMVTEAEVSEPVYGNESLESLSCPRDGGAGISFGPARFSQFYLDHPRRAELATTDEKVFYFRFRLRLDEAMKLRVLAGSDGPFALFCDGGEVMRVGTANPLIIDEFKSELSLAAGRHDFYFAMSSNTGHAWGVCCRFARLDGKNAPVLEQWQ